MAIIVSFPDSLIEKLIDEAKKMNMDIKSFIRYIVSNYIANKTSIDLSEVIDRLDNIEKRLANIEERIGPTNRYRSPKRKSEIKDNYQQTKEDNLDRARKYAENILANNNGIITTDQLRKVCSKFKVDFWELVERLGLFEEKEGIWKRL